MWHQKKGYFDRASEPVTEENCGTQRVLCLSATCTGKNAAEPFLADLNLSCKQRTDAEILSIQTGKYEMPLKRGDERTRTRYPFPNGRIDDHNNAIVFSCPPFVPGLSTIAAKTTWRHELLPGHFTARSLLLYDAGTDVFPRRGPGARFFFMVTWSRESKWLRAALPASQSRHSRRHDTGEKLI